MDQKFITKSTGERQEFIPEKLRDSLILATASKELADRIVEHIGVEIKDGMSTKEIYRHAFEMLERDHKPVAVKYSMRKAVMDLGPTGFPFENFVAEIFRAKGFEAITDVELLGSCVPHELDVVAWNENKLIVVEAKFHNVLGVKSDLKVALYIKARFDDLRDNFYDFGGKRKIDESWLVTNTKFSKQAIHYAECKEMKLVGWNYPAKGNLQELIEDAGLEPITCLRTISLPEKRALISYGVILCKQALENPDIALQAGIHGEKIKAMMEEIREIRG
jgi:hypothetical protein